MINTKIPSKYLINTNESNTNGMNINHISFICISIIALLYMLTGYNDIVDTFIICILTFLVLFNLKTDYFLLLYFSLVFFENLLVVPVLGGSFFRIYQIIFIIRILIKPLGNRKGSINLSISSFAIIFFALSSLLYSNNIESIISTSINMIILYYIYNYYNADTAEREKYYDKVLFTIGFFAIISGLYGLIKGNAEYYGYSLRYESIIGDPNYSCYLYIIGIFSMLGTNIFKPLFKNIMVITLISLLFITVSMSGILGFMILYILYKYIKNPSKSFLAVLILIIILIVFLNINLENGTVLYGIQYRILSIINNTNVNSITSGRTNIWKNYLNYYDGLPAINKLFGGYNTVLGDFRDYMVNSYGHVSHNTYIDMLFMTGAFGVIVMMVCIIMMIYNNIKKYKESKNNIYLSTAMIKIAILYYMLTISIFPYRYFYTFFLM